MVKKQFYKNVIPSMFAFAFSGVYSIVDGLFVGRNVGDIGLASINIAYPLTSLIIAVGTGIGMGGAIQGAIAKGKGNEDKQKKYLGNTMMMIFLASIIVTVLLYFASPLLLSLFGAKGEMLEMAKAYFKIIALGATVQIVATGSLPIIRNYGGAMLAMIAMIMGFSTNVVLDYLFVEVMKKGVAGAALATVIGQSLTVIPCVIFLLRKKNIVRKSDFKLSASVVGKITKVGLSPFGLTISPNIVIIIMNVVCISYGGETAVACYAVISYVIYAVYLLLQGIGDGSQPLISVHYGSHDFASVKTVRSLAYGFSAIIAVVGTVLIYFLRVDIAVLFGMSPQVTEMFSNAMPLFISTLIFVAVTRVTTSYFYAIKRNTMSYILIYGEPILICASIFIFAKLWGMTGVWLCTPIVQIILSGISLILLWKKGKLEKKSTFVKN